MVILVFHYNITLSGSDIIYDANGGLTSRGYLAVDFFFVLSGFILTHVYAATGSACRALSARNFYIKRLARVYPVHFVTLLMATAGGAIVPFGTNLPGFPAAAWLFLANMLLLHAWGVTSEFSFNQPSWSISAEWFAYLCFPLIVPLTFRTSPLLLLLGTLWFFALFWWLSLFASAGPLTTHTFDFGILRILPEFLLGIACYRVGQAYRLRLTGMGGLAACTLMITALVWTRQPDILIVLCFAWLILIAAEQARENRDWLLGNRAMVYLGEVSYSLYMFHYLCLGNLLAAHMVLLHGTGAAQLAGFVIFFGMTLFFAILSFHFIELPARQWLTLRFAGRDAKM
jgi:peptidoglycan/LPS O-acetylase OafA/YrhL